MSDSACEDPYHCTTCADEGVPMRVDSIHDATALCDGVEVFTALVGEVEAGDELLVHAGVALVKL